jgi:hypothetical protein
MKTQPQESLFLLVVFITFTILGCGKGDSPAPNPQPPAPTVTGFSPVSAAVGEQIIITGTNFSTTTNSNLVKFNGTSATVSAATATELTVMVPASTIAGKISVTVNNQTATSTADFILLAMVSSHAGSGTMGNINGTGTAAQFGHVTDLVVDAAGNIYVADGSNSYSVRKVTSAGVVTTLAGSGTNQFADGTGTAASFSTLLGIALDGAGNVYVADLGNNRIRKITPAGVVTTIGGTGVPGLHGWSCCHFTISTSDGSGC